VTDAQPGSRAEQRRRTEDRILDAATQSFFAVGYERTTIRAVASAAGVDAGLVMHYFGSKQDLFRRVIDAAPVPEPAAEPGAAAEEILAGLAGRLAAAPVASLTILRSMLTNPEAADAVRDGASRYIENLAQAIPSEDADLRAAVINAVLLGVTISRHLLRFDALADADPQRIVDLLRPGIVALADTPGTENPSAAS
jgi:AcrR family transcriptional regulator